MDLTRIKTVFCTLALLFAFKLSAQDSVLTRNQIFIEGLGNNYSSPFRDYKYVSSLASLNYSRNIKYDHLFLQLSLGVSFFKGWWVEDSGNIHLYHRPTELSIPIGFLLRKNYKRKGLWVGAFFTSAFGKQSYVIENGQNAEMYIVNYDFQIMPNLCYQVQAKTGLMCRISFTPKISLNSTGQTGYLPKFFPFWGGISFGYGW